MGGQGEVGRRGQAAALLLSTRGQRHSTAAPVTSPPRLSPGLRLAQEFWKREVGGLYSPTSTPYLATGRSSSLSGLVGCCVPLAGGAELQPSHSSLCRQPQGEPLKHREPPAQGLAPIPSAKNPLSLSFTSFAPACLLLTSPHPHKPVGLCPSLLGRSHLGACPGEGCGTRTAPPVGLSPAGAPRRGLCPSCLVCTDWAPTAAAALFHFPPTPQIKGQFHS